MGGKILRVYEITDAAAMRKCGGFQPDGRKSAWCVVNEQWFCNYSPQRYYMFTVEDLETGVENWLGLLHNESNQWKCAPMDVKITAGVHRGEPSARQEVLDDAGITADEYHDFVLPILDELTDESRAGDLGTVDPYDVIHDIDVVMEQPNDILGSLNYNVEKWEWELIEAVTDQDVDQMDGLIAYAMGQQDTDPHANEPGVSGRSVDTPPDELIEVINDAIQKVAIAELHKASKGTGGWMLPGEASGQQRLPFDEVYVEEAIEAWFAHIYNAIYEQAKGYEKWVKKILKEIGGYEVVVQMGNYDDGPTVEIADIAKWRNTKGGADEKAAWGIIYGSDSDYDELSKWREEIASDNYDHLEDAWSAVHEYALNYENLHTQHPESEGY
jgi:hypothetical protein